ncbi:MAG TPA: hypothetical protein VKB84_19980 [Candidatus Binataceae bacterium]|nr:hypothetical protein [Candidatus Binataceae bacterium]
MALRKVTLFDHRGLGIEPVDEEGQAKPAVLGVRWVNPDTLETIYLRGGKRTDPKGQVLSEIKPTLHWPKVRVQGHSESDVGS